MEFASAPAFQLSLPLFDTPDSLFGSGSAEDRESIRCLTQRAENGNAEAMYELGCAYLKGERVARSPARARHWLGAGRMKGHSEALYELFCLVEDDAQWPVADKDSMWRELFERAHPKFIRRALLNDDLPPPKSTVDQLKKAAKGGDAFSLCSLGDAYAEGELEGFRKDEKRAVRYYKEAVKAGDERASMQLGYYYYYGKADLPRDFGRYIDSMKFAAKSSDGDVAATAAFNVAVGYSLGRGVERDDGKAVEWYKRSASWGDVCGCAALAYHYLCGRGVERSASLALLWHRRCLARAKEVDADELVQLAKCHVEDDGFPKSEREARRWLEEAAQRDSEKAVECLREMDAGRGITDEWHTQQKEKEREEKKRGKAAKRRSGKVTEKQDNSEASTISRRKRQSDEAKRETETETVWNSDAPEALRLLHSRGVLKESWSIVEGKEKGAKKWASKRRRKEEGDEVKRSDRAEEDPMLPENALCVVCSFRCKAVLQLPCKHLCCCAVCFDELEEQRDYSCPICKTFVEASIKVKVPSVVGL